jgi:NAD/NADP transhydrogenase alpha subunit
MLVGILKEVVVEPAAGPAATFADAAYVDAGARSGDPLSADLVLAVNEPAKQQLDGLREHGILGWTVARGYHLMAVAVRRPQRARADTCSTSP